MKLKIKKIGLLILILFFVGTVRADWDGNPEEQKFSDPFSDRSWGSSQSGGLRGGDNPNETGEGWIGSSSSSSPVGDASWLSLALLGLTYSVYLFGKKRKEGPTE